MTGGRRRFARSEIRGKTIRWLVDVTIGARVYHWSTIDLDVDSDDGVIHYDGVLGDVSFSESMSLLAVAEPARMTLTAQLDEAPELLRAGRDMRQAAEASRWVEGTTYEERVPRMRGFVSDPVIMENSIEVTIDAEPFEDVGCIPERTAVVDATTQAGLLYGEQVDLPYPTVIGNPGRSIWSVYGHLSAVPARWIDLDVGTQKLLIAGHEVEAGQVILSCDAFPSGRRFVVTHEQDSLGRTVAVVDVSSDGSASTTDNLAAPPHNVYYPSCFSAEPPVDTELNPVGYADSDGSVSTIYTAWTDLVNPTKGRGVMVRGVGIREAGDVARYVLGFSTIPIDDGAWDAAKPYLAAFKIDCMINAPVVPWEWLTSMLLPLLPLSIVPGPWGVRPVVLRWGATADDAVGHLDETTGSVVFDAGIEIDSSKIINKFSLKFGLDTRNDAYNYKARRSGKREESTAYAKGRIVGDDSGSVGLEGFDYINIQSTTRGPDGIYRVVLTDTGAGAVGVSYDAATRTVTIDYNDTVDTTDDIATAIRAASPAYITCDDDSGTTTWDEANTVSASQTLILPDEGTAGDYRCAVSQARLASTTNPTGVLEESTETPLVYDPNTANAVLEWRAAVYALPHRRVIVVGDCSEWEWVQLGDPMLLSSSRLALDEEVGHIESLEIHDDGQIIFRCLVFEDPIRHGYTA